MSDVVELRMAGAGDAAAIRALTREAYAKWVPLIGREPRPMTADYAQALKTHRFDLLYAGGRLAALIETIRETDHLLIENVAVSPSFQGRGFGRILMAHAEEIAASHGFGGSGSIPTRASPKISRSMRGSATASTARKAGRAASSCI